MPGFIGSDDIVSIHIGSEEVVAVYHGSEEVFTPGVLWAVAGVDIYAFRPSDPPALVGSPGLLISSLEWDGDTLFALEVRSFGQPSDGTWLRVINRADGSSARISNTRIAGTRILSTLAWDGQTLFGLFSQESWTIDRATGRGTRLGAFGQPSNPVTGAAWDGTNLYVCNSQQDSLFTIDRTTAVATPVGVPGALGPGTWNCLAWDRRRLYAIDDASNALFTVNRVDGTTAHVQDLAAGSWSALTFAPKPIV